MKRDRRQVRELVGHADGRATEHVWRFSFLVFVVSMLHVSSSQAEEVLPAPPPSSASFNTSEGNAVVFATLPRMTVRARQVTRRGSRALIDVFVDVEGKQPPRRVALDSSNVKGRSIHLPDGRSMTIKLKLVTADAVELTIRIDQQGKAEKVETSTTIF